MKKAVAIASEVLPTLAITAWVGGHAALGAFAARIVFRDLPRSVAAPTMTTIFRSFDHLMIVCVIAVGLSVLTRASVLREKTSDRLAFLFGILLTALGAFEYFYVHPSIEQMFQAGRTLEPAFASLHKLSERCGHLEIALSAALFGSFACSRRCDPATKP